MLHQGPAWKEEYNTLLSKVNTLHTLSERKLAESFIAFLCAPTLYDNKLAPIYITLNEYTQTQIAIWLCIHTRSGSLDSSHATNFLRTIESYGIRPCLQVLPALDDLCSQLNIDSRFFDPLTSTSLNDHKQICLPEFARKPILPIIKDSASLPSPIQAFENHHNDRLREQQKVFGFPKSVVDPFWQIPPMTYVLASLEEDSVHHVISCNDNQPRASMDSAVNQQNISPTKVTHEPAAADTTLEPHEMEALVNLKERLTSTDDSFTSQQTQTISLNDLSPLLEASNVDIACEVVELANLPIETTTKICDALNGAYLPTSKASSLFKHLLFKKLDRSLDKVDRGLSNALIKLAGSMPTYLVDYVLAPIGTSSNLDKPHVNLISDIAKKLPKEEVSRLFQSLLKIDPSQKWSMAFCMLLTNLILSKSISLSGEAADELISHLQHQTVLMVGNANEEQSLNSMAGTLPKSFQSFRTMLASFQAP